LLVIAAFQIIMGLQAINGEGMFHAPEGYYYDWSPKLFGWVHIISGIAVAASSVALAMRRAWAAYLVLTLAAMSAVWNFLLLFFFPTWSGITIAIDILVIWTICRTDVYEDM